MRFLELVALRQSDRKYTDKSVEKEKIERCLEAARLAPSANNSQPWVFIVVDEPNLKNEVGKNTYGPLKSFNKFVPQAPIIIAIVQEKPKKISEIGGRIKDKEYPLLDIGIAAEHFCLQAAEEGLGTCILGWFDERKIKALLNVPEKKNIPLLITLGYVPENYPHRLKVRQGLNEMVRWNSYC